jgi:DNA (cytosine-5)-methyltransferase 1
MSWLISFEGNWMIRFVDLFAGIGGIRLAMEQALAEQGLQGQCVLSSEIQPKAQETYALNYGHAPQGDIYGIQDFPAFDFLLAGFPCQPFSYAGKQKGFGDTRGTLFFEIEKRIAQYQPEGFLLENVRGLTSHDEGRTLSTVVEKLELLGYGVHCLLLNSSDFNVPQNRVRIYILGLKGRVPKTTMTSSRGASDSHQFKRIGLATDLFTQNSPVLVRDVLESNVPSRYDCSPAFTQKLLAVAKKKKLPLAGLRMIDFRNGNSVHSWELGIKGACSSDEVDFMNALIANRRKKTFGSHQDGKSLSLKQIESFYAHPKLEDIAASLVSKRYLRVRDGLFNPVSGNMSFEIFKILDPESISITLVSSDAHKLGVHHEGRLRHLTPRECARIQGYPDSFQLHPDDGWAYHQLGNSVSVPVVRTVLQDMIVQNSLWSRQKSAVPAHRQELLAA